MPADPRVTEESERGLWEEHGELVGRVCTALVGDPRRARAAVEATFAEAHAARAPGAARAWILGLARAAAARVEASDGADTTREPATPATRARAALGELKPTERDAVVLWRVGGLTLAEVAAACGVDEPTARARVDGALRRLRAIDGDGRGT